MNRYFDHFFQKAIVLNLTKKCSSFYGMIAFGFHLLEVLLQVDVKWSVRTKFFKRVFERDSSM